MKASLVCLPSLLVVLSYLSYCDPALSADEEKPPLILEGADSVRRKIKGGKTIITLDGDVRWSRGESRLRCDRANYFEERDLLFLSRNVRLIDQGRRIYADSVRYKSEKEYAVAMGNVKMEMAGGDIIVRSDSVDYDLHERESWAFKRPELSLREGEKRDDHSGEIRILGDCLHMLEDNYLAISGEVDISGDSLQGGADSLNYDMITDRIVLLCSPWVEVGSYRLTGETIELSVPERVLRRGISKGNARGEQRKKTVDHDGEKGNEVNGEDLTSWIEADSIFLSFRDDRVESLLAVPDARSYYRVRREEVGGQVPGGGVEENYVVGDEILLVWNDGLLDVVRVRGRGEGVYLKGEGEDVEEKGVVGSKAPRDEHEE